LAVVAEYGISADDVDSVHCLIAAGEVPSVCEPEDTKVRAAHGYDAQFSVPYVVSAALHRNRFTLNELEDEALNDTQILDLAGRVTYEEDPNSAFPTYFSGEIRVKTKDGRELVHREQVNRGAGDRPLSADDIITKFIGNAERALPSSRVEQIIDAALSLDSFGTVKDFGALLRT
jgi:2-methylcitrate dehydratase PrpD